MCPVCITTVALIVGGATSTGGVTAFTMKKLHARAGTTKFRLTFQTKGGKQDGNTNAEQARSSESCVVR